MNNIDDEMLQILRKSDVQVEKERMASTYKQWRFGVGLVLISIFLLILSLKVDSAMYTTVSIVCLFIGVFFIDKGIRSPTWKSIISNLFLFKKH